MWRYSYFVWLFAVCGLWGTQAQIQESCLLDQTATHQQQWFRNTSANQAEANAKIDRMKEEMKGQIQALQAKTKSQQESLREVMKSQKAEIQPKIDTMKDKMGGQLKELQKKTEDLLQQIRDLSSSGQKGSQPPSNQFSRIGSRYFYIERRVRVNWFDAYNRCRQMGGHLATINDELELQSINRRLVSDVFWLDINSMAEKGNFLSTRTGKRPPLLKWHEGQPVNGVSCCANLGGLKMFTNSCYDEYFFICQSDQ